MITKIVLALAMILSVALIDANLVLSQMDMESETQWVWGRVESVDALTGVISIKCLDLDTEEEQEITVIANPDTALENFNSLDEIISGDSVSVDYIVTLEGQNVARSISLEKSEPMTEEFESEFPEAEPEETSEELEPLIPEG